MKARSIGLAVALLLILSACQNFFAPQEATTYTVTYAGNGSTVGAGPTDGHKYKPGDAIAVLGNSGALTKAGFAFTAWNTKADGSGTSYAPAASFAMGNANVSLYAVWGSTYTVIYNGNGSTGGTAPADAGTYVKDATVTVLGNTGTLVKTGSTFAGWNTAAGGTGTGYATAATFTMGTANVTLYAVWTQSATYTVTYDGNGFTGGAVPLDTNNYLDGATVTTSDNTGLLVKTNNTFAGWNTKADGTGTSYAAKVTFTMGSANVPLYAVWTKNPTYTVAYDGNGNTGGTVPADANNYQVAAPVTVIGNTGLLTKTGSTFGGWNTKADGTGTCYAAAATFAIGSANVPLYAAWTAQKFAIRGNIQKGPFSSGSSITIQALDANLDPLGTSYQTVTNDDFGAFALGSQITSKYVEVIAKGYYFNEISGSLSASELTLRAITDLSTGTVANVNLLTTLEEKRVVYLIKTGGLTFSAAKAQAETELLAVFNIKNISNLAVFETMDISKAGESNAILLAISCILQRANTVAQLSELISKISLDIETDGTVQTASTKAALANYSADFTAASVTTNLKARYANLGLSNVAVPDFSPYLDDDSDGLINKFDFTLGFTATTNSAGSTNYTSNAVSIVFPPNITAGAATVTVGLLVVNGTDRGASCQVSSGDTLAVRLSSVPLAGYYGQDMSSVVTVTYGAYSVIGTYTVSAAAAPTYIQGAGNYTTDIYVVLSCTTANGNIYYTTNGTTPTTASTPYSGAISVGGNRSTKTIKAIATAVGYTTSAVSSATYTINYPILITTIVGTGVGGFAGDGAAATSSQVNWPVDLAFDATGNLYIADQGGKVRKVSTNGIISTFAGTGTTGYSGDGGAATSAQLTACGIAFDSNGTLYIADQDANRIRKVSTNGIISTFAGNGTAGYSGDGGAATSAQLNRPKSITFDSNDNLYIAELQNNRIRKVFTNGTISTYAGTGATDGMGGYSGDGGPATSAQLGCPFDIAFDTAGNLYIADTNNNRIRKVSVGGTITTVAGNGSHPVMYNYPGDGKAATSIAIRPQALAFDGTGNLYLAEGSYQRVLKMSIDGTVTTIAGNSPYGNNYSGEGGLATNAHISGWIMGLVFDPSENLMFTDASFSRIFKVTLNP